MTVHSLPFGKRRVRKNPVTAKPEELPRQWVCNVCQAEIGVATSEIITLTIAPLVKGTKLVGGSKQKYCSYCYIRGRRTPVP